ncbi:MAG: hypothetical protein KJ062_17085 [Thermoanaerobaculia bacterium]|nr:hypothetical protein [Thermoanaerobaculia bacterium]
MRRVSTLIVLGLVGLLVGPLAADKVVLRDGRTLDTKKPPQIRGRQAVLTLADGRLVSIPASEIDTEKTAALARQAARPGPTPEPTPVRAPSLADAARAAQTAKKATVTLTDQDVRRGDLLVEVGPPEGGEGDVRIGPVTTTKGEKGWTVEGSVLNAGQTRVLGVAVTIVALTEEGKPIATTFGQLAKDGLEPGEQSTFRSQIETDQAVDRFTYLPRWKVVAVAPTPKEGEPRAEGREESEGRAAAGEEGQEAPPPPPAPTPAPEPEAPTRPGDMAAPPANAPVGSPARPGGTYLPPPSSSQPKPPGGGS